MASKSLGTLTIDLIAKVGGFTSGMDKAQRASEKWARQVQKDAAATSAALLSVGGALGAAALAAGTAGFALLKSTSEQVNATDQWAKSLKMSTQELLAWQFAAEKAGVAGDNMADIFKDLSDKIGDAVLNKSGEAVDALNALGLSAEKLSKVSPDKQMLAIGDALGKISTNAGKVNILESLGNDLSKLLPLFDNNNAKLNQFIQLAKDYGVAPDPQSIDDLIKVNDLFQDMEAQVKGLKMQIAAGLAHVDLSPLNNSLSDIRTVLTDPKVLQGIADLVSQVAQLAGWLIKAAAGAGQLASTSGNRMAALGNRVDMNNPDQIQARIDYLNSTVKDRGNGLYDGSQTFLGWIMGKDDSVKAVSNEISTLTGRLAELSKQKKDIKIDPSVTPESASSLLDFALPAGGTNGKAPKDTAGAKLESAFKTAERSYMRQIELIDTTGKKVTVVTEQQKLQFDIADGKLKGLNETQKTRLEMLAKEVDRLNAVKKANEENAKVAAFVTNLQAQNINAQSSLNIDVQGAGLGDKARQRMKERLNIEREYLDQRRELQTQYQSGDITQSVYDRETSAINSAMSDRLKIQEDYYKSMDAMQENWTEGVSDGLANWLDSSSDYSSSAANIVSSSMDSALDNVANMLMGNKASWKDWASSVLSMIAKVALQMAAVNLVSGIVSSVGGAAASGAGQSFSVPSYRPVTANAKGGVYESHDLSQYSSSVVSSPTMFAFAKGAGLMGEAGPEAIMPLTRAADGSLGVRAIGGDGGSAGTSISVSAPVTIQSGGAGETSNANTTNAAQQLKGMIEKTINDWARREMTPGGILSRQG
ncbi:phage tail tape measure protein [Pantoea ananatis]|uniref:phage tail tape measure protein n=1 Tax=Pantoea ananas TaxID=553 RepID=UPI001B30B520|nr:phage tail tape measure protein [Pantoea ananatis]